MIEETEAFNRVSRLLEYVFVELKVPTQIRSLIIAQVWENKELCLKIDRKVSEIWKK